MDLELRTSNVLRAAGRAVMEVFRVDTFSKKDLERVLSILTHGGVIAFPTDTAYGLGADPFNRSAVRRVFDIKERRDEKAILLLVDSIQMAERAAQLDAVFYRVAAEFWPGPLTLIVRAAADLPEAVTAGRGTVGLRWPAARFPQDLVGQFGRPVTGTSANRGGQPSSTTAAEVRTQLDDELDALIDGGELPARGGSTLLDLTEDPPVLLREGPISFERLRDSFNGRVRRHVP